MLPGRYAIRLEHAGRVHEQTVTVADDLRMTATDEDRRAHHQVAMEIAETLRASAADVAAVANAKAALDEIPGMASRDLTDEIDALEPLLEEIYNRLSRVYGQINGWTGPSTADQRSQIIYLSDWMRRLAPRVLAVSETATGMSR